MNTFGPLLHEASAVLRVAQPRVLTVDETLALIKRLAEHGLFDLAAAVAEVSRRKLVACSPDWIRLSQKLAFYTSKDQRLPLAERLEAGLKILDQCQLATTTDQETLGLAGSIYKRKWERSARLADLQQSANYYSRGHDQGIASDGYVSINAAFVLDLLAHEVARQGLPGDAAELHEKARSIRRQIIDTLAGRCPVDARDVNDWWLIATLIEAAIGTGDLTRARAWLGAVKSNPSEAWQRESMLRQLVRLIEVRGSDAGEREASHVALAEYFPTEAAALRSGPPGRLGLALSGGGFRAALFHLGVLAALAEADVLRHVEVLSCVSGGSIVGAHYYLLLRHLLQTKADGQISRGDYLELVQGLIATFREGTRANIRMLSLANLEANLKMLLSPQYTRADRVAELYDEHFFSRTSGVDAGKRVLLREIGILPAGHVGDFFNPERDNWGRRNKAPALLLNSTTLNTGHGWQFTTSRMGEIRFQRDRVDSNPHLRSLYYEQAPPEHRDLPLSRAVAASSCVPALFPPVRLLSLYPQKVLALVDGAICDNQGVAGLLAENCHAVIVSDAAGHISAPNRPPLGYLGVAARSMAILQTRLREAQYRELSAMNRLGVVDLLFLHLKQGLRPPVVDWEGCEIGRFDSQSASSSTPETITPYGVLTEVQDLLARMRTDLDAFSDMEANALMYDGYRIANHYLSSVSWLERLPPDDRPWPFLVIQDMMTGKDAPGAQRLVGHLRAGAQRGGKWLRLSTVGRRAAWSLFFVVLIGLIAAGWGWSWSSIWSLIAKAALALGAGFLAILAIAIFAQRRPGAGIAKGTRPAISQVATDVLIFMFGWIPAVIDVNFIRPAYLKQGSLNGNQVREKPELKMR